MRMTLIVRKNGKKTYESIRVDEIKNTGDKITIIDICRNKREFDT